MKKTPVETIYNFKDGFDDFNNIIHILLYYLTDHNSQLLINFAEILLDLYLHLIKQNKNIIYFLPKNLMVISLFM